MNDIKELIIVLSADKRANTQRKIPKFFGDYKWKFLIYHRIAEYFFDKNKILTKFFLIIRNRYALICNYEIPLNTIGKGIKLPHNGPIIINSKAKIGDFCEINSMVNIGNTPNNRMKAPQIGNNIFIGPGAKIFGDIKIADCSMIGANAVVNKTFDTKGSVIVGIPARVVKIKNKSGEKI